MDDRPEILLISDGELDGFGGRLLLNAFRGRPVRTLEEATELASSHESLHAALLPTSFDFAGRAVDIERLRKSARSPRLRFVAAGDAPDDDARQRMGRAGVDFLLAEPITDSELRFVLNAAVWQSGKGDARRSPRVPTDLVARVHAGTGAKVASIYNLSVGGAFLETPRPSQEQAQVEVEIPLPSGMKRLRARVVLTNVAGNLKRENLPRGMGVQWVDAGLDERAALEAFVEEQMARFRP